MRRPAFRATRVACALLLAGTAMLACAGGPAPAQPAASAATERTLDGWLLRLSEATRRRAYQGTLVVSSASGWNSARIWHVCNGEQQLERVDSLTGLPRQIFRHDDQVLTLLPQTRQARLERRDVVPQFPELLKPGSQSIPEFYALRVLGHDRVAGFEADVLQLSARDAYRYSYRIWSEKKTGLVLKLQTLDGEGRVLEQSAFSELHLDVALKPEQLIQQMRHVGGYHLEKIELAKTSLAAEGWALKAPVPGYGTLSCLKRPTSQPNGGALQWVLSDGLATVSVFIETFDPQRHSQASQLTFGATQVLTQPLKDASGVSWWLTLVGEVPLQTLQALAQGLERRK